MKVIDTQNRQKLDEGRSTGMGFAFTKKVGEEEYETVHPISPCKDYLNDVVFSEITGKECHAYGLSYYKQSLFEGDTATMAAKIMKYKNGNTYTTFDIDKKMLGDNYSNVALALTTLEKMLGLTSYTSISPANDDIFLIEVPLFWCQSTYLISMYSLLVRCSMDYKEGDYLKYLDHKSKAGADSYMIVTAIKHIKSMIDGKPLNKNHFDNVQIGHEGIHNHGIMSYNQPIEEDEDSDDDDDDNDWIEDEDNDDE